MGDTQHFKFVVQILTSTSACVIDFSRSGCVQGNMTSLIFGEITDNISETVKDRHVPREPLMVNDIWPIE